MRNWTVEAPTESVAGLLDPHRELVGFAGRSTDLAALTDWAKASQPGTLQLITGGSGVGKTRLAVEFARRLRTLGWQVEWAGTGDSDGSAGHPGSTATPDSTAGHPGSTAGHPGGSAVDSGGASLLIVDDADTRVGLGELLSAHAGSRVLLIGAPAGRWLDQLELTSQIVGKAVSAARSAIVELGWQVDPLVADADVATAAADAFADALGLPTPTNLPGHIDEHSVLDAHIAALVAVLGPASGADSVLAELLGYEQRFWYAAAREHGVGGLPDTELERALRQVVAAECLLGAAAEGVATVAQALNGPVADWLREIMPPDTGEPSQIGSLTPKRLAELHVAAELARSPELASTCLTELDAAQAAVAIPLLARASTHTAQLPDSVLRFASAKVESLRGPANALSVILNSLPYPSAGWAAAGAAVCAQICGQLPEGATPALSAYWLNNLGARYWLASRQADALAATEEAVRLRRELAQTTPGRFRPALAASLNNLATQYFGLDRHDDAIDAVREAAELYRDLAAEDPDRYRPGLAASLSTAGIWYALAGQADEALAVSREAVEIRRGLAAGGADRQRADLARSLSNLAVRYAEQDQQDEAVATEQEVVSIRRELAAEQPDDYTSDLLNSLTKLAARYDENDRADEAATASAELVSVRRKLAAASPQEHLPQLARALNSLAIKIAKLGRGEESLDLHTEAVASYRQMEAVSPGKHLTDLALSLNLLSARLVELHRTEPALTTTQDAVAIRRRLAAANPEQHRSNLARSLRNLASLLDTQGRSKEAKAARKEAGKLGAP